jgi:hypothetical protein
LPEWDVIVDGRVVGRIEAWRARGASATFYRATTFDARSGKPIPLESSTDFDERVQKIVDVHEDPDAFLSRWRGVFGS